MNNYSSPRMKTNACRTATTPASRPSSLSPLILDWNWRYGLREQAQGNQLTFARPGAASIELPSEIGMVGNDIARYQPNGLLLEGSAQNINTWSNEFTAARGHTLTDCTTAISTEYTLTDINGAPRYAYKLTATANSGRAVKTISTTSGTPLAVSCYVKRGLGRVRFAGYDGANALNGLFNFDTLQFESVNDLSGVLNYWKYDALPNGWYRLSCVWTPKNTSSSGAASIGCELANDWCYISGSQFEVNTKVATSYIYTEASAVTRASEGADTSGNGLQVDLSTQMLASLNGYR